jgi:IS30 family transposase
VENAIGRLRRLLPRKTNLDTIDHDILEACIAAYNNTPRKCLQFRSPAEVFLAKLLHFKCESTPSLRSG